MHKSQQGRFYMTKYDECREIIDSLQNTQWRTEGLSELFCNLKGDDGFHITEGGLYGVALILEDIKEKIRVSSESLEIFLHKHLMEKT